MSFLLIFNKTNILVTNLNSDLAKVSNSLFQWDVSVKYASIKQAQKNSLRKVQQTRYTRYMLYILTLPSKFPLKNS